MEEKINIRMRLKNGIWQDAMPNFGSSFDNSNFLEPLNQTWTDIWEKVKKSENIMSCINSYLSGKEQDVVNPVSLSSLNQFLDTLEKWVQDNENNLTFPATKEGWKLSVYSTIEKNDLDTFIVLCGSFPEQISSVINIDNIPENKIKKWWNSFNQEQEIENKLEIKEEKAILNTVINENIEEVTAPSPTINSVDINNGEIKNNEPDKKSFSKKPEGPFPPSQDVKNSIEELNHLIDRINENYEGSGPTLIDDYCKRLFLSKGVKEATETFTKVFFSSFQHMDENKINFFIDNLPKWRERPLETRPLRNVDVNSVLDDIVFWSSLKYMEKKVSYNRNQEILKSFVPSLLDISTLSLDNKLKIGKNMLKFAKNSEEGFKNKLMLWISMGGSITEQKMEPRNGVFDSKKNGLPESLIKWISESNNPKWDKIVVEYAKEKDLNLYKWYPNDFKSKDLLEMYESSTPVSKPNF